MIRLDGIGYDWIREDKIREDKITSYLRREE